MISFILFPSSCLQVTMETERTCSFDWIRVCCKCEGFVRRCCCALHADPMQLNVQLFLGFFCFALKLWLWKQFSKNPLKNSERWNAFLFCCNGIRLKALRTRRVCFCKLVSDRIQFPSMSVTEWHLILLLNSEQMEERNNNLRTSGQMCRRLTVEIHFLLNNCGNVSNSSWEISHEVSFAFSVFEG